MACLFCEIIKGTVPAKKCFENEYVLAFEDIHPQAPTHLLIIPKQHVASLNDIHELDSTIVSQLFLTIQTLAKEFNLSESGHRVIINTNQDGGQTVDHLHCHLLGGRKLTWPPG